MKRKFLSVFCTFAVLIALVSGCANKSASASSTAESEGQASSVSEAVASEVSSTTQSGSSSSTTSEEFFDVADGGVAGMNEKEYELFTNPETTQTAEQIRAAGRVPSEVDKNVQNSCTLIISCATVLNNMDKLDPAKRDLIPENGIIFSGQNIAFYEGESAFDVLLRETKNSRIHMEFNYTPGFSSNYVEGIQNLYERDCGDLSGWTFRVNGQFPATGASNYALKDGDVVEWLYTCNGGKDL